MHLVSDSWRGSRRRLLGLGVVAGAWVLGPRTRAASGAGSLLSDLRIANAAGRFAGDGPLLATVGGPRGGARLTFMLRRRATVTLSILETGQGAASERPVAVGTETLGTIERTLGPGRHTLDWTPAQNLAPRTYITRLSAHTSDGAVQTLHAVARVLGIEAAFAQRSAAHGETATLVVRANARTLTVELLRSGPEAEPTYGNTEIKGVSVAPPVTVDWSRNTSTPAPLAIPIGDWPSGVYAARVTSDDGRVGFAPLVIRPSAPRARVAVVMPTSTWGAYNFYDANGDGWGDTWYARWKTHVVDLSRPHASNGVPYRYRSYDLAFQRWLVQTGRSVDIWADEDLEGFVAPKDLRAAYDLVIFPGHTEYVTLHAYELIQGYRDLGGNLMFLSANNFFRKITRNGVQQTLVDEWRDLGRPESSLLGNQYIASDRGQRRAPFTVVGVDAAPWAFEGTGLANGSTFGLYGIEIDARSQASPQSTEVLAHIPDLFGPGRTAEMTYYEHWSGAQVFSAGVLDFGGQMLLWPQPRRIIENVFARLAA